MSNENTERRYWIWGQFDHQSSIDVNKTKEKVNRQLLGPEFDSHLTLSGPLALADRDVRKFLNLISNEYHKFNIYSEGIEGKDLFFQSLFIKIREDKKLLALKKLIDDRLGLNSREYFPHISLFYGKAKKDTKRKIIEEVDFPEKLVLSSICLVAVYEEIDSWNVVERYQLKGKVL